MKTASALALSLVLAALGMGGCASTKIWAKETLLGQEKRDQLVKSVESARNQQNEAKETFASALDELLSISSGSASTKELEAQYRRVESAYTRSESKAKAVRTRIESVERVAGSLFKEWGAELDQYASEELRAASSEQLEATQAQYGELLGAMKAAASKMDPVLAAFKDQTLFLKHNLNAQAIASLKTDLEEIRVDVQSLIREMESAIAEADAFISSVRGG
jgi:DNA repair exonuclease SbcCD ATPase subunit